MSKLIFQASDVRRVVEHSLNAPTQGTIAYTDKPVPAPAVLLVHDQGVYLMSNGEPRDIIDAKKGRGYVAYAEGCNPDTQEFDDWWETSRELVGGDDFGETLPWAKALLDTIELGADKIVVTLTARSIKFTGLHLKKVRA